MYTLNEYLMVDKFIYLLQWFTLCIFLIKFRPTSFRVGFLLLFTSFVVFSSYNSSVISIQKEQIVTIRTFPWFFRVFGPINFIDLLLAGLFYIVLLKQLYLKRFIKRPLDLPIIILTTVIFLGISVSIFRFDSYDSFKVIGSEARTYILIIISYYIVSRINLEVKDIKYFFSILILIIMINLVYGLVSINLLPLTEKWTRNAKIGIQFIDHDASAQALLVLIICVFLYMYKPFEWFKGRTTFILPISLFTFALLLISMMKAALLIFIVSVLLLLLLTRTKKRFLSYLLKITFTLLIIATMANQLYDNLILTKAKEVAIDLLTDNTGTFSTRDVQIDNAIWNLEERPLGFTLGLGLGKKWVEHYIQPYDPGAWSNEEIGKYKIRIHMPVFRDIVRFGFLGMTLLLISSYITLKTIRDKYIYFKNDYVKTIVNSYIYFSILSIYFYNTFPEMDIITGVMLGVVSCINTKNVEME
jgi:hypothetical protein